MVKAVVVEVAEAIVEEIRTINLGEDVIVRRSYGDENDQLVDADLSQVFIDVEIFAFDPDLHTPDDVDAVNTLNIFIRKNLSENEQLLEKGTIDIEEKDRLILIVEKVWEHFSPADAAKGAVTTESGYVAKYDPSRSRVMQLWNKPNMKRVRQFTSWIRLTYMVSKEL